MWPCLKAEVYEMSYSVDGTLEPDGAPCFTEDSTLPGVYCHVPSPLQSSDSSIRHHSLSPQNNRVLDAVEITVGPQLHPKAPTSSFKPHTSSLSWHTSLPAPWTLLKVSNRVSSELAKVEMRQYHHHKTNLFLSTYYFKLWQKYT